MKPQGYFEDWDRGALCDAIEDLAKRIQQAVNEKDDLIRRYEMSDLRKFGGF